jgi:hypothetical protein
VFPEEKASKVTAQTTHATVLGTIKQGSYSAATILAPNTQHPLLLKREEIRENGYHGKSRQALGKAPMNLTTLPSFTTAEGFKFGDKTVVGKILTLI